MPSEGSINVFLSYGTDWKYFALGFRSSYVGSHDRTISVFNWQGVDAILPGEVLDESLYAQIEMADVFVAFVDDNYNSNERKTRLELEYALRVLRRRGGHLRLVFLLLSSKAKNVIRDLPYEAADIIKSIVQEECYDENDVVFEPKDNPALHLRIVKLREKHLNELRDANGPIQAKTSELSAVILLDRAILPDGEAVTETSEGLAGKTAASLLQQAGAKVFCAQPGWHSRINLALPFEDRDLKEPAFVQVLSGSTAPLSIEDPGLLARRLSQVISPDKLRRSRLVCWLPEGEPRPADLGPRLQAYNAGDPIFRGDSVEGFT
jgi:hypothetical protein